MVIVTGVSPPSSSRLRRLASTTCPTTATNALMALYLDPLTPRGRTAQLTSKVALYIFIQQI